LKVATSTKPPIITGAEDLALEIDGGQMSGSGTILRLAVAIAAIRAQPIHIFNIRRNRPEPGLKPQHLQAVLTAAKMCNAELEGAFLNSREIWFRPHEIQGGNMRADIGTAGSIPMLLITVLPMCLFAKNPLHLTVTGGTDTTHSPTINYLKHVLLTKLKQMGFEAEITVNKYGYYPKGGGEVTITTTPQIHPQPLELKSFGTIKNIKGISICTFLAERKVAERQAKAANDYLSDKGYFAGIQIVNDRSNPFQKGSSIALWAETTTGVILGADAIGELGKASETVGRKAAANLHRELSANATVDVHLADMLIPYVCLAQGKSTFFTRELTDHLKTNLWLSEKMLNTRFNVQRNNSLYRVERGD
jgi:RNA 3'-terminal phosphate cyclase (ATP)